MFVLFFLIAIYISGRLKNNDHKIHRNIIKEYHLPLMKLFTVNNNNNNNNLPFITTFTANKTICR